MGHKVFIFVPAFGQQITAATFLATHALQQHFASKSIGGGISTLSFPDIAELRAMATTIWYDAMPDSTHLLFVDADMGFPPEMVTDMMLFDEPIVGTIYRQRKEQLGWAGSGTGTAQTERRGNFMVVEGVGMGVTLIRRDMITKMIEAYPHMIDTRLHLHPAGETMKQAGATRLLRFFEKLDIPDRGMISEDLSFCIRWNQIGGKVWAAIGYRINHVGPYDYHGRYLDIVEAQEAQAAQISAQQAAAAQQVALAMPVTTGGTAVAGPMVIVSPGAPVTQTVSPAVKEFLEVAAQHPPVRKVTKARRTVPVAAHKRNGAGKGHRAAAR